MNAPPTEQRAIDAFRIQNRDKRLADYQNELAALRAENARLREELRRALNWMTECADREKAQSYKRGYLVRIQAASAVLSGAQP